MFDDGVLMGMKGLFDGEEGGSYGELSAEKRLRWRGSDVCKRTVPNAWILGVVNPSSSVSMGFRV